MADAPYLVEPAKSNRSTCKASKEKIDKGELRFGSAVDIGGHKTYHWRKLAYITAKQVSNLKTKMGAIENIGGWNDISPKQQKLLVAACKKAEGAGEKVAKAKAKAAAAKDKLKAKKLAAKAKKIAAKAKAKAAKDKAKAKKDALKEKKAASSPKVALKKPAAAAKRAPPAREEPAAKRRKEADEPKKVASADLDKMAHKAIDLAKDAKWRELLGFLSKHPDVVNVRPAAREYNVLHQAAWHGSSLAVNSLLDDHGADPKAKTKSGQTAAEVAEEQGHSFIARTIEDKI
eukprot:TRINITY_DN26583_c0_g1_i1.p1 TRINITY_DN26583_c0_g1~~TRINITY_DN26583_c0_g1_i1.p1  ORF type:complete len:289 (-),score=95.20 TRINITY_DN26583_c0_g1_i1:234-1100(-)